MVPPRFRRFFSLRAKPKPRVKNGHEMGPLFSDQGSKEVVFENVPDSERTLAQVPPSQLMQLGSRPPAPERLRFSPSIEQMRVDKADSLARENQTLLTEPPRPFHHCNLWRGPELTKTNTDPAVSFAILTAPMKGYMLWNEGQHELRKYVVVWGACRLLDPVVYTGSDFELLCKETITQRRNLSVGQVHKFYKRYGTWMSEHCGSDEAEPLLDSGLEEDYALGHVVINGVACNAGQPTHASMRVSMVVAARRSDHRRKQFSECRKSSGHANGFGPSPLRQLYTPESMKAEEAKDLVKVLARRRVINIKSIHFANKFLQNWADLESESDSSDDGSDDR